MLGTTALLVALALPPEPPPTRRELLRAYYRAGELTVVYGAEDRERAEELAERSRRLAPRGPISLRLVEAASATREHFERGPVALVGTPRANRFVAETATELPLRVTERGFAVGGRAYEDAADSLQVFSPSPFAPRFPIFLVTGNSDDAVVAALDARGRGDLEVRRAERTLLVGFFERGFGVDGLEVRAFDPEPASVVSNERVAYYTDGVPMSSIAESASRHEELLERLRAHVAPGCRPPRIEVHVYRDLEDKGLATHSTAAAHFERGRLYGARGHERETSLLLVERWLEGCGAELPHAIRRGLARVVVLDGPELDELDRIAKRLSAMSTPPKSISSYAREALETSFARFLLGELGGQRLAAEAEELSKHERRWSRSLREIEDEAASLSSGPESFQHGITFAHEGYQIVNGYLSRRAERSLERLRKLEVDAVAVVPYAFMRDPGRVEPLRVPTRPGSETDEEVVAAITRAREKGMAVLLKPQIWLRGSWPGAIELASEADVRDFFEEYRAWILHYALMAERHRVPLLAIGTELEGLTRGNDAAWAALIRDVRRIYRGKLVYAANWGREVEQVSFWPLLDYIGVDFYYPLGDGLETSDEELQAGFERALERLRSLSARHGKPVLLTEIGYASTAGPWRRPHVSEREEALSLEDQARAYEIAFRALEDETSWIRGMYWWKWPSDLDLGGEVDRGFTPNGKPAEGVLRRWYSRRLE